METIRNPLIYLRIVIISQIIYLINSSIIVTDPDGNQHADLILQNTDSEPLQILQFTYFTIHKFNDTIIVSETQNIERFTIHKSGFVDQLRMSYQHQQKDDQYFNNQIAQFQSQNLETDGTLVQQIQYVFLEQGQNNLNKDIKVQVQNNQENTVNNITQNQFNNSLVQYNKSQQLSNTPQIVIKNNVLLNDSMQQVPQQQEPPRQVTVDQINSQKVIVDRQYENLGFYHKLPLNFVNGEIFLFEGIVTNQQTINFSKIKRINVLMYSKSKTYKIVCTNEINSDFRFNISCQMRNEGVYSLYIFPGTQGKTNTNSRNIITIQRLVKPDFDQLLLTPYGLRTELINNCLYIGWDSKANITNLTIFQQKDGITRKKQYLLSNNHQRFKIPFRDFNQFLPITTYVQISHAMSMDGSLKTITTKFTDKNQISFEATDHAFDAISQNVTMFPPIPWQIPVNQKFSVTFIFNQQIKSTIYITEPDLVITKIMILTDQMQSDSSGSYTIKAGTEVFLQLSFSKLGTHIIEINNVGGIAVMNRPIYIGSAIPLIPDFRDLGPLVVISNVIQSYVDIYQKYYQRTTQPLQIKEPPKNSSDSQKRQYLLVLINGLRRKFKVNPVQLDQQLNVIAQNHSDDMVLRNFFGHQNPDGQRSKDRAKKFNFNYIVGQNIAQTYNLIDNHLGLQRSATHLQNTINRIWVRVGIGINTTKTGQYIVTYLFSVRDFTKLPLQTEQKQSFRNQMISIIMQKNPNIIQEDKQLSQDVDEWMQSQRSTILLNYINVKRGYRNLIGFSVKVGYTFDLIDRLRKGNTFDGFSKYSRIGLSLGVQKAAGGVIQIYFVFY